MDEASKLLENLTISQQQFPTCYHKIPPNLPLVYEGIDLNQSTFNPTLPWESETHVTQVDELLVDQVVESIPSSVDTTLPLESEVNTTQVLIVTSDSYT